MLFSMNAAAYATEVPVCDGVDHTYTDGAMLHGGNVSISGGTLTVKFNSAGALECSSDAVESPIWDEGGDFKGYLTIDPAKDSFYNKGLGRLKFVCNGFGLLPLFMGLALAGLVTVLFVMKKKSKA